ncbi:MAG: hypothetical protein WBH05_13105, partial [Syntrophobacteria bacterium]
IFPYHCSPYIKDSRIAGSASLSAQIIKADPKKEVGSDFFSYAIKVWVRLRIPAQPRENIICHVLDIIVKLFHDVKTTFKS